MILFVLISCLAIGHIVYLIRHAAAKVVELQKRLPRARVVYCSATSVSEPKNLGFMNRLGLWGPGTEHGSFNKWLGTIERLGTGAIELNAMHLKSIGALQARQLSYETCDFAIIDVISDDAFSQVYHEATEIWIKLHAELLKSGAKTASFWAGKHHYVKIPAHLFQ